MSASYTSELARGLAPDVLARFLRYVQIDTQSRRDRTSSPSTPGQLELGRAAGRRSCARPAWTTLAGRQRLRDGDARGRRGQGGTATQRDRPDRAHGHQSGRAGAGRRADRPPRLRRRHARAAARRYGPRSGDDAGAARASVGHDIVTTSGDTLLGADDKAGVAEIMAAVAYLAAHPELPRPTLRVAFTPDEEIGEGATLFDIERFGARLRLHARRLRVSASSRTRHSARSR